jgi:magnesium transporter
MLARTERPVRTDFVFAAIAVRRARLEAARRRPVTELDRDASFGTPFRARADRVGARLRGRREELGEHEKRGSFHSTMMPQLACGIDACDFGARRPRLAVAVARSKKKRKKSRIARVPASQAVDQLLSSSSVHEHERVEIAEPQPGASPGTLLIGDGEPPRIFVIDYGPSTLFEKELTKIDDVITYLTDEHPSITWIDVRGITNRASFERLGEIFKIHPLALEDVVNVPQRPHTDEYPEQQVIISRMVQLDDHGAVHTEQLGIVFGQGWVLTIQEEPTRDCLDGVRSRIRKGKGNIRSLGADYLAYAILDAVVDSFFPLLEVFGERLEELEHNATQARSGMSTRIHDVKREMLTMRRAIWPQRDVVSALLRAESKHVGEGTRIFLRDTYDHAVQVMDIVETYREIAGGLMDLYLSGVSNRMNEVMKVLTIISTIFLPLTFIAGIYGMNFDHHPELRPTNMPELTWRYGYLFALGTMLLSTVLLLVFYWRKGWIGSGRDR